MSSRRLPPPSPKISREEAGQAVDALLCYLRAQEKLRKAQLFEHDDLIYLHLNVRRIPSSSRLNPLRIPLPHSLHPLDRSRTSLCLIADDSLATAARSRAASENLPFDSVIPLSELRRDYVPFEARRRLCGSYDMFFADRKIIPLLSRIIGNFFFRKKKMPLSVDISRKGWPEAVRQACRCTLLYFRTGTCSALKVGRVSMDRDEIIDNLMAAIDGAVALIPKKWANLRSMYVKAVQSVALPIYQALPVMGMKINVAPMGKEEDHLNVVVDQERDKKMTEEEKKKKKEGRSKKRKGRIHDVDYVGAGVDNGSEEEDEDSGAGEKMGKKTIKKKGGKGKVKKSKIDKTTGDEDHGAKEKGSSVEFIGLGTEKKRLKKAKKVLESEEQEGGEADGKVNVLNIDDAFSEDDDSQDDIKLPAKKRVKDSVKRSRDNKRKMVDEEKASIKKEGVRGLKKGKIMKSGEVSLKKVKKMRPSLHRRWMNKKMDDVGGR
ncbi:60S ribosomal protein L10a [Apostasia shenzhenica]|uniref:60S ribosomal protein L10a n=1 Tax=Apostasia shenzhenica TaxID=1088818 RepID=A0A2I0BBU8_9ASPA|nr:60S ribosomal protein L10a [Apostasia shenzhenica]